MPDTLIPLNTIVIGYPAENPAPEGIHGIHKTYPNFYGGKEDGSVSVAQPLCVNSSDTDISKWLISECTYPLKCQ